MRDAGAHLEAVKAKGLTLRVKGEEFLARVTASDDPAELGPQDFVISTLKACGLGSLAAGLRPLLRDDTGVVFAQNGVPWWYDIGLAPDQPPPPDLGFLDPGGVLRAAVVRDRIIGGVIFSSNEIVEPGLVVNDLPSATCCWSANATTGRRRGSRRLRTALSEAGVQSPPVERICEMIWTKLTSNMSVSVLCLLTGKTARASAEDSALLDVVPRLMDEAQAVGRCCYPKVTRRTGKAPDHKPSLLQDYERGRPMEIDALVRAPAAFARAAGLAKPMLDMMAGLAIRRARDKGLYPD